MKSTVRVLRTGDHLVYGLTIPKEVAIFVKGVTFNIEMQGTTLILKSGCDLETIKKEAKNYSFDDIRI